MAIAVVDTGVGIAPADLSRLYRAFEQLTLPSGDRPGGTGLGLALTKRLVEMHGGAIDAESELGSGQPSPSGFRRSDARILVVEDDLWSRRIVLELLELRGHDVLCATGVSDGRAQLDSVKFDAVLLDINIPDGSGELLLHEIREYNAVMPVIAFTASTMAGDRERFLAEGFTGHVSKPIDAKSFGETIEAYLLSPA